MIGGKQPGKAAASGKTGAKGTRRKKRGVESWGIYIYKVLKQVHPGQGISKKAMSVLNSFINDTFEKLALEAARLGMFRLVSNKNSNTNDNL